MMTIRSISHVLTVATFVLVSNSCFALMPEAVLEKVAPHKATIGAIALGTALDEDKDAAKAALETLGVALDQKDPSKMNPEVLPVNFVANYVARKVIHCLAKNGMELPDPNMGNAANHVIKPALRALKAATPQIVAGIVTATLVR